MNGVIEDLTGRVLRAGPQAFVAGAGESLRSDVPEPAQVLGDQRYTTVHVYTGAGYVLRDQSAVLGDLQDRALTASGQLVADEGRILTSG